MHGPAAAGRGYVAAAAQPEGINICDCCSGRILSSTAGPSRTEFAASISHGINAVVLLGRDTTGVMTLHQLCLDGQSEAESEAGCQDQQHFASHCSVVTFQE